MRRLTGLISANIRGIRSINSVDGLTANADHIGAVQAPVYPVSREQRLIIGPFQTWQVRFLKKEYRTVAPHTSCKLEMETA